MKKALVLVLALAMLLGCTAMAEGNLIGYTCMDRHQPLFFVTLEGAIREVVEAHGDELISLDPQNSNENQISQIEDLISRGIKAIFLNPVDRDGVIAGLDLLKDAEHPDLRLRYRSGRHELPSSATPALITTTPATSAAWTCREVPGRRRHHRAGFPDDAVRRGLAPTASSRRFEELAPGKSQRGRPDRTLRQPGARATSTAPTP